MDEVSYLKFSQHADLRALLFRAYPAVFFVQLPVTDPFWRDGAGIGMNELGRSLMRVREQLCVDVPIVVMKRSYPPQVILWPPTNTRILYGSSFFFLSVICVAVLFWYFSWARRYRTCIFCSFVRLHQKSATLLP